MAQMEKWLPTPPAVVDYVGEVDIVFIRQHGCRIEPLAEVLARSGVARFFALAVNVGYSTEGESGLLIYVPAGHTNDLKPLTGEVK